MSLPLLLASLLIFALITSLRPSSSPLSFPCHPHHTLDPTSPAVGGNPFPILLLPLLHLLNLNTLPKILHVRRRSLPLSTYFFIIPKSFARSRLYSQMVMIRLAPFIRSRMIVMRGTSFCRLSLGAECIFSRRAASSVRLILRIRALPLIGPPADEDHLTHGCGWGEIG